MSVLELANKDAVPQVSPKAPTVELGITNPYPLPSWAQFGSTKGGPFVDYLEYVPELRWPISVRSTYPRMHNDTQLKALMRGTVMPIVRYTWQLDPNDADATIVSELAADLNLPLMGDETSPVLRRQNRFGFAKHQLDALRSLEYGHYFFEQVGTITAKSKGGDGLWHLKKLAPRPPRTIGQIFVETDGNLAQLRQYVGFWSPALDVGVLAAYVWDQEPGNWVGISMFRACYREWLIKDRLLRIDAINHERGGGIPYAIGPPDALQDELDTLGGQISNARVGEVAGIASPYGSQLGILRAHNAASPIESINRHDEAMARAFLMMFISLGSTQTGSRALGDSFTDFAEIFRESIAGWFAEVFNEHVIEDWVDWNYGGSDAVPTVPRLVYDKGAAAEAGAEADQFAPALLDPATKAAIAGAPRWKVEQLRARYDRHARAVARREEAFLSDILGEEGEIPLMEHVVDGNGSLVLEEYEEVVGVTDSGKYVTRSGLRPVLKPVAGAPTMAEVVAGYDLDDQVTHDRLLGAITKKPLRTTAAVDPEIAAVPLPNRSLRRQPTLLEAQSRTDFAALDRTRDDQTAQLVAQWQTVRQSQVAELQAAVAAAEGDLAVLARIAATPAGRTLIDEALKVMATAGATEAVLEAKRQGVTDAELPDLTTVHAELEARAGALEQLLAASISQAGANKAVQLSGGALEPATVAATVSDYLSGLSDAYLTDQFGGALAAAQNAGRLAAMGANQATRYYASELLDVNTCDPCTEIDGTEFASAAEAASAYPSGGFSGCLGGPRCRGTVVAIYGETEPTVA